MGCMAAVDKFCTPPASTPHPHGTRAEPCSPCAAHKCKACSRALTGCRLHCRRRGAAHPAPAEQTGGTAGPARCVPAASWAAVCRRCKLAGCLEKQRRRGHMHVHLVRLPFECSRAASRLLRSTRPGVTPTHLERHALRDVLLHVCNVLALVVGVAVPACWLGRKHVGDQARCSDCSGSGSRLTGVVQHWQHARRTRAALGHPRSVHGSGAAVLTSPAGAWCLGAAR